jgi:hypothetical protein
MSKLEIFREYEKIKQSGRTRISEESGLLLFI